MDKIEENVVEIKEIEKLIEDALRKGQEERAEILEKRIQSIEEKLKVLHGIEKEDLRDQKSDEKDNNDYTCDQCGTQLTLHISGYWVCSNCHEVYDLEG